MIGELVPWLLLLVCIVFVIQYVYEKIQRKRLIEIVNNTSECLKTLREINNKYSFEKHESFFLYTVDLTSKSQFDNCNVESKYFEYLSNNADVIWTTLEAIKNNKARFQEYEDECKAELQYSSENEIENIGVPFERYKKMEIELCARECLQPMLSCSGKCIVKYTSPKGRNQYEKSEQYDEVDIVTMMGLIKEKLRNKETKENQRKLMTKTLRYQILKRDGYRCQLCGKTVMDGTKLEVDHIIPVSKGGKTVPENLQTLCFECNRGKRDSI